MAKLISKLPHWAFVGWVGLFVLLSVICQQFLDLSAAFGWGVLTLSTFAFYLLTIEQQEVRCEKAGWILTPGGVLAMLACLPDIQLFLVIISIIAILYAVLLQMAQKNNTLRRLIYHKQVKAPLIKEPKAARRH